MRTKNFQISVLLGRLKCNLTPSVRAECDVAFICRTYVRHGVGENITRDDIKTTIVYTSTINPGGWVPKKALRTVYRREYPRFLRTFTQYVLKKEENSPLKL